MLCIRHLYQFLLWSQNMQEKWETIVFMVSYNTGLTSQWGNELLIYKHRQADVNLLKSRRIQREPLIGRHEMPQSEILSLLSF